MWQRLSLYDVRVIGHYLGMLLLISSAALVVPLVCGLLYREWDAASHYLIAIGITLIAGSVLRFLRVRPGRLGRQQAIIVTGLSWIVLALFASIPLMLSGHYVKYPDALFDAVSGLTTTGASVVVDLDHLSNADNMWRFVMHLMGGLGLVVIALSLGLFGRGGGSGTLFNTEGRSEHVVPNVVQSTRFIASVAMAFIALSTVALFVLAASGGMQPDRAFLHALWMSISAFMTAGFAPMSQSMLYYHSRIAEVVLMVVMLLGSVNFALHAEVLRGRVVSFFRDLETVTMAIWLGVVALVFAASVAAGTAFMELPAMLRRGLFTLVSAFSTTGFLNVSPDQLSDTMSSGAFLLVGILMAVGGGASSTAGGIKVQRLGIIAKSIVATVKETLSPDSARVVVSYNHIGRRVISAGLVRKAMTVAILYVVTYVVGALIGIAHGYDSFAATFESIAMASNGGLTSGIAVPGMPFGLEAFYIFEMWAGRLEFLTLLALIAKVAVSVVPAPLSDWWHVRRARQ